MLRLVLILGCFTPDLDCRGVLNLSGYMLPVSFLNYKTPSEVVQLATEEGLVIKAYGGSSPTALVRTGRSDACKGCSSRSSCESGNSDRKIEIEVSNTVRARPGDMVLLNIAAAPLLKATFLIYIFPILSMVLGACLGHGAMIILDINICSNFDVLCSFLFLILSFALIHVIGRQLSNKSEYKPMILRIVSRSSCTGTVKDTI